MMSPVALTSVVALLCSLLVTLCSAAGALSAPPSYPVFGTKRYTRGNLVPTSEYGSGGIGGGALSGALGLPVYHRLPSGRYYDAPLTSPQYFPFAPYQQPSSTVDYYDDTGYYGDGAKSFYYLPPPPPPQPQHRRYQRNNERYTSYGLPTYRGEYKPTPYYYAHGPSYSYTDDHESSNPLDDLHEEMLQEDERERALDYYPVGQEQWYESPSRPDSAFLRNLILYNQQLQNYGRGMSMLQQQQRPMIDGSNEDDFEDYDEPEPDYEYEGAIADPEPGYDSYYGAGYAAPAAAGGARYEASGGSAASNNRDALSKLSSLRSSMAMNQIDDDDDEEVQELKSLIHQQKSNQQRLPPMFVDKMAPFVLKNQQFPAPPTPSSSYQKQHPAQYQIQHQQQQQQQQQQKQAQEQLQRQQQQQQQQHQRQKEQQQKQLLQQQQQQQQLFQEQQREQQRLKELQLQQQQQKQERELKQQQLLRTLSSDYQAAYEPTDSWQKDSPSYNAYDYDNEYDDGSWSHWDRKRNVQPKKATFASKTTSPVTTTTTTKTKVTTTVKPAAVPTSTTSAPVTIKPVAHQPGQKEVVLPRPTNPRNAFSASLLNAVAPSTAHQQQQQQHGVMKVDQGSMAKQIKSSKIYDTIKAMVNMRQQMEDADLRQQLEHQKQLAHIRKRFVSNEESLVQQLDGLKRSA
ncbi:GATA zinc finger domain-containing protein 10-like [Anopheles aquasalis]|uniref:GATA zinc finger domain-containing protein 10-like n=1 Tax=Anopheles aquasalis TaxID=42839 RepID=UPI00215AE6A3|nr:GATA zinc finger domain-containing protein 10-like [Anopheles aquasalis]